MKRIIAKLLLTLLFFLLLFVSCALSQDNPLANLIIQEDRVSGIAPARFGVGTEYETLSEIKVDFPLPSDAYPAEILTVSNRYVSKKQMQTALKAAEQSTQGQFINPRGTASYTGNWNAEASADISKEDAAAQAIGIALRYFEALGVEVDPVPYDVSRPYDYDAYIMKQTEYYQHRFSDTTAFIENANATWKRREKYQPRQKEYTHLSFYVQLEGMRLSSFNDYPAGYADEPDAWIGFPVSADAIVSDSGILVEASCPLFEIKKRRSLSGDPIYEDYINRSDGHIQVIPAENWQQALTHYLSDLQTIPFSAEQPYQNQHMTKSIIQYASRIVITGLEPVLHTISEDEWAPFWKVEIKDEFSDGWRN